MDVHGPDLEIGADGKLEPPPVTAPTTAPAAEATGDGIERKTAPGIWASNAFHLEQRDCFQPAAGKGSDGDEVPVHAAVFATIARFNHSCIPSCYAAWNPNLGRQTVHALRAISAGEELTIAYLGGTAWDGRRSRRREELWRKYRFWCTCEACSLSGESFACSEARRANLFEALELLLRPEDALGTALRRPEDALGTALQRPEDALGTAPGTAELLATVEALWGLAHAEGLPAVWYRAWVILAMRHAKEAGDAEAAIRWAERGAQSACLALGAGSPTTTKFEMVVRAWKTARAKGDPLPG